MLHQLCMNHQAEQLKARTAAFAKGVIELCAALPQTQSSTRLAQQLIAAATSVNANYRATCRARSRAEFAAKLGVVCEEADECCGWLELLVATNHVTHEAAAPMLQEADELTAIFNASRKTAAKPRKAR